MQAGDEPWRCVVESLRGPDHVEPGRESVPQREESEQSVGCPAQLLLRQPEAAHHAGRMAAWIEDHPSRSRDNTAAFASGSESRFHDDDAWRKGVLPGEKSPGATT